MDFSTEYISARIFDQKISFALLALALSLSILALTFLFLQCLFSQQVGMPKLFLI